MNKTYLFAIAAAFVAAPIAFAHTDGGVWGTPKPYCENMKGDQNVHDYAAGGTDPQYFLGFFTDGNMDDCDLDGVPYDFDGHEEWAMGGARLQVSYTGCGVEWGHHPSHPTIWAFDPAGVTGVVFRVGADLTGPCGNGIDDIHTGYCVDHCTVNFPPGVDGAYHVYVEAFGVNTDDGGPVHQHEVDETGTPDTLLCIPDHPHTPDWFLCIHDDVPRYTQLGHIYT